MKVFIAGASGAVGKRLVPLLVEHGHQVTGTTRSRPEAVRSLGATAVTLDVLDRDATIAAVAAARPDVVVHQATALKGALTNPRHIDRAFATTNRLRSEGTDNLLAAAQKAGAERFVAQSFAGWPSAREGGPVKTEDDPLDPDPPAALRPVLDAIRHLERAVTSAEGLEGVVLRYGGFYGPGTSMERGGGEQTEMVRKRRMPIVGDGGGIWSLVHIDDVATATLAAIERGTTGIYKVSDDEPAPVREWLPVLADALGAKPPRRVPRWLARLVGGEATVVMMTEIRGSSNAKARRELGWAPRYATWRDGFASGL
jgi:nucleoside-diphosphate-sugar epimerase